MSGFEAIADLFHRGGPVMWVLLVTSMTGSGFALERFFASSRQRQMPADLLPRLRRALAGGGVAAGRELLAADRSAFARVLDALLARSGATRRELEGVLDEEAGRVLFDLRGNLRPVGLVASLAPLLGLLGTVFGLIDAFRQAAELGMDDPSNFAQGIYAALYTTAFGLVVAIPFLVAYHVLKGRLESLMRAVEDQALAFILAASAGRSKPAPTPETKAA